VLGNYQDLSFNNRLSRVQR